MCGPRALGNQLDFLIYMFLVCHICICGMAVCIFVCPERAAVSGALFPFQLPVQACTGLQGLVGLTIAYVVAMLRCCSRDVQVVGQKSVVCHAA